MHVGDKKNGQRMTHTVTHYWTWRLLDHESTCTCKFTHLQIHILLTCVLAMVAWLQLTTITIGLGLHLVSCL